MMRSIICGSMFLQQLIITSKQRIMQRLHQPQHGTHCLNAMLRVLHSLLLSMEITDRCLASLVHGSIRTECLRQCSVHFWVSFSPCHYERMWPRRQHYLGLIDTLTYVVRVSAVVQKQLREYCKREGIQVAAYSSLGSGHLCSYEPVITASAGTDVATTLLRWALQQVCLPPLKPLRLFVTLLRK